MTQENVTGGLPAEGTTPSQQVEKPKEEVEQLRSDLQKMEQNLKSAQGVTKKQAQDLEALRAQYEAAVSSRDTYQALIGLLSQQTGRSEEDITQEVQNRKPDLIKQAQAIVQQQEQQRRYAQFNQKVNEYQKKVEDLGLKPTDKTYKHIRALVRSGDFETADEEIEAVKAKPTTEPVKEQKVELTEEEKEKISKEYLEKKGLLKSETGTPSAGGGQTFTEDQIADRKFYEENREAILKAYKEGKIKKSK
jgi:multidrug efflux pump subunit AcrA (membrane-fusion protein)